MQQRQTITKTKVSSTPSHLLSMIKAAKSSGCLNLSSKNLTDSSVPEELCSWHSATEGEKWWELMELTKLDISHNSITHLPPSIFLSLSELKVLQATNAGLQLLPDSIGVLSSTLAKLVISDNQISVLPSSLTLLTSLQELRGDGNALTCLLPALNALAKMDTLSVSRNKLTSLPDSIGGCTALCVLSCSSNSISCLPACLSSLMHLRELEVASNRIIDAPDLSLCMSLQRLDLRFNKLTCAPKLPQTSTLFELLLSSNCIACMPDISNSSGLATLDLGGNKLKSIDGHMLIQLKRLKCLDLRNNDISELDPVIGGMTTLQALVLEGNPLRSIRHNILEKTPLVLKLLRDRLTGFPSEDEVMQSESVQQALSQSQWSRSLDCRGFKLVEVPPAIAVPPLSIALQSIDMSGNQVSSLPAFCLSLPSLTFLDVSRNKLTDFPALLCEGSPLATIKVSKNALEAFPLQLCLFSRTITCIDVSSNKIRGSLPSEFFFRCRNLEIVNVAVNQIRDLPETLGFCEALRVLDIGSNQIQELPIGCRMLTRLHTLSIENNSFSSLPPLLAMLPSLNALLISGNPLKTTSRSLLTSGTANIIKWLRERGSDVPVWQQPQQSLESVTPPLLPKSLQDLQPHAVRSDSSVPVPSAFLQNLDAEIVELESRLQSSVHISQAQAFALKKQLQMKRAERIRSERTALAAASTYNLTEIYRK
jgi:Leucine-rich repeat (LRR) protein